MKQMVTYVKEEGECRSRIIGKYFGDSQIKPCGICDNCLKQKKRDEPIPIEIYTKYRQKILEIIPTPVNQIVDYQFFNNKDYVKDVIRKMIENEEIKFSELGVVERIMR